MEFLLNPNLWLHIINSLVFFWVGFFTHRAIFGAQKRVIDWREVFVVAIDLGVLLFYFATLVHAQYYGGEFPGFLLSGMAWFAFGSLVGDKQFLLTFIQTVRGK